MANKQDSDDLICTHEDNDVTPQTLEDCLEALSQDIKDFCLPSTGNVPEISLESQEQILSWNALRFHRDWVAQNRPVIFRGAVKHWPAYKNWQDNDYFRKKLGNNLVTVSVTPNGYADAALPIENRPINAQDKKYQFVMPHEEQIPVSEFLKLLETAPKKAPQPCDYGNSDDTDVYYIQKQNSNLTDEWNDILHDVEEISWATEAFGKSPDAINFWMGDSRAVTSTHKDPYENMYTVLRGHKDIILYPPSDVSFMPYKNCKQSKFERCSSKKINPDITTKENECQNLSKFSIVDIEEPTVPWIVIDPLKPDLTNYPDFKKLVHFT